MQTKHDMSGGYVKLNLDELIDTAISAIRYSKSQMDRYQSEIDNSRNYEVGHHANHHAAFYGDCLANAARDYATALATYHALVEAKTRETVEIER